MFLKLHLDLMVDVCYTILKKIKKILMIQA